MAGSTDKTKPIYICNICGVYTEEEIHCGRRTRLFLDSSRRKSLSKLMSFLLRHDPESIGLKMDRSGWVYIDDLVDGIRNRWRNSHLYRWVEKEHVIAIAMLDPKGRFEICGDRIRARYGHSKELDIEIDYLRDVDTKILYHGTAREFIDRISIEGLKPMNRCYVHLSTDMVDACIVGERHSRNPVVLKIDADCVRSHGIDIYIASKNIRLAKHVPRKCIIEILSCRE